MSHPYVEEAQPQIDGVTGKAGAAWRAAAREMLLTYLHDHTVFIVEELRTYAEPLIGLPHDSRAWGGIIQRASREGLIRAEGAARARSSHGSWKPCWHRVDAEDRMAA